MDNSDIEINKIIFQNVQAMSHDYDISLRFSLSGELFLSNYCYIQLDRLRLTLNLRKLYTEKRNRKVRSKFYYVSKTIK